MHLRTLTSTHTIGPTMPLDENRSLSCIPTKHCYTAADVSATMLQSSSEHTQYKQEMQMVKELRASKKRQRAPY